VGDPISLSGRLDLSAVGQLHDQLLARTDGDVTISLAEVTQLGALCVQVLISAARTTRAKGFNLHLTDASGLVLSQLAAMGLTPETIMEGST
jgi:chemotaxis protein CheX